MVIDHASVSLWSETKLVRAGLDIKKFKRMQQFAISCISQISVFSPVSIKNDFAHICIGFLFLLGDKFLM